MQLPIGNGGSASGSEPPPLPVSVDEAPVTPVLEVSGDSSEEEEDPSTVRAGCHNVPTKSARLMTLDELHAYHRSKAFWGLSSDSSFQEYSSDDSVSDSRSIEDISPQVEIIDLSSDSEIWIVLNFNDLSHYWLDELELELIGM